VKTERVYSAITGELIYVFTVGYAGIEQLVISETRSCCDRTPFLRTCEHAQAHDFDVLGVKHNRTPQDIKWKWPISPTSD